MSAKDRPLINANAVAARMFPAADPVHRACRVAISEIGSARTWLEHGCAALGDVETEVWRDLDSIRNPGEDFDELTASIAEDGADLASRFLTRAGRHLSAAHAAIREARRERELSILAEQATRRRDD